MLQDFFLMTRLPARVPRPVVVAADVSREVCPFDFEIVAEAQGRRLSEFDESDEIHARLRQLGEVVARLHQIRFEGFGFLDVRPLDKAGNAALADTRGTCQHWREYVERNLAAHVKTCRTIGAIDAAEAAEIRARFVEHAAVLDAAAGALLHGDLGNHNVFVDESGISALIDWEDCLVGDPVYDIAFWATFHPERRHEHFLAGYRQAGELPADFDLRFWLYFLRVSLAKTVHRHRFGYADRPDRPPPSRRIQLSLERLRTLAHN
jgi:aminoglycoside phosphotransferase (APT) family kinase protein